MTLFVKRVIKLKMVSSYINVFICLVVSDFVTPWTVARQAPLSVGFPRQEYWTGLPFPSAGDLPNPGIEPVSLALAGGFFITNATQSSHIKMSPKSYNKCPFFLTKKNYLFGCAGSLSCGMWDLVS